MAYIQLFTVTSFAVDLIVHDKNKLDYTIMFEKPINSTLTLNSPLIE